MFGEKDDGGERGLTEGAVWYERVFVSDGDRGGFFCEGETEELSRDGFHDSAGKGMAFWQSCCMENEGGWWS